MHTTRGELFFLLNEVFINECPPVIIKLSFSLRVCEVEQNNVPPVLVSDSHPQTTGFGAGGAFLLRDDKSSRAQQFMLIVANLCRVTIRAIFPRRVLASLWSWPAHTHTHSCIEKKVDWGLEMWSFVKSVTLFCIVLLDCFNKPVYEVLLFLLLLSNFTTCPSMCYNLPRQWGIL